MDILEVAKLELGFGICSKLNGGKVQHFTEGKCSYMIRKACKYDKMN